MSRHSSPEQHDPSMLGLQAPSDAPMSDGDRDWILGRRDPDPNAVGKRFVERFGKRSSRAADIFERISNDPGDPAHGYLDTHEEALFVEIDRRLSQDEIRRGHDDARRYRGLPHAEPLAFRSTTELVAESKALRAKGVDPYDDAEFLARLNATPGRIQRA